MKRNRQLVTLAAILAIGSVASAQTTSTIIESWENPADPADGWTVGQPAFTSLGLSSSTGVTNGSYSWIVGPSDTNTGQGPDYSDMLASPSTMDITTALANSTSLSIDVYNPAGSFGYYQQWDLAISNDDLGYVSVDNYSYSVSPSIGNESTLTWDLPSSVTSVLATSTNPTSINFQIGGGYTAGSETMYLDNVVASNSPPPVTFSDVNANWVINGSGDWETAANWSSNPQIPGGTDTIGAQVTFDNNGGSITANPTVTLSQNAAMGYLVFGSTGGSDAVNYTINSGKPGTSINVNYEIDAYSGNHIVNVPVTTSYDNYYFEVDSGASLTIPNFSDTSYTSITKLGAGALTLGASLHLSVTVDGTLTFIDGTSGGWLYGLTVNSDGIVNLGANIWNTNTLSADAGGGGLINIPAGGTLYTAEYLGAAPTRMYYSGKLSGGGNFVIGEGNTSTDTSQIIYGNTAVLYGDNSAFSGTITVGSSFPTGGPNTAPAQFGLEIGSAATLGDGSATNKLIFDGGLLRSDGSFNAAQNIQITGKGGTIDTDGYPGGDTSQPLIPGGTAISFGSVTGTDPAAVLTKINDGQLTVSKITGVSLVANAGTVKLAPNGTAAGASSLNGLTLATTGGVPQASLDITNNAVTIAAPADADPINTIVSYLLTAYDQGKWDGAGIQSSSVASQKGTGIGYADGNTDTGAAAAPGTILIMDTWLGDVNLDGAITSADTGVISADLGMSGADWAQGDLNYDGFVNGDDISLLLLGTAEYKAGGSIPVPEPAAIGLIAAAALPLMRRRRP